MAIKSTQRGGAGAGRGDAPYAIHTPMVDFTTPQEEEQKKKKQQAGWRQPDWTQVTLMQLSPASRLEDGNPFT